MLAEQDFLYNFFALANFFEVPYCISYPFALASFFHFTTILFFLRFLIFFIIIIPFFSVLLVSFLSISFYMKISAENLNSDITEFKEFYYNPDKTACILNNLDNLTPLSLAIWYMDDGGLSQQKDKNGNIKANDLMLNTHFLMQSPIQKNLKMNFLI